MRLARVLPALGLVAMAAALIYGFTAGDFTNEGALLTSMPWGIVSLVDLYTGFALFSGWILYREKSLLTAIVWVAGILTLGFFAGSLYALLAMIKSGGDWHQFWLGRHA